MLWAWDSLDVRAADPKRLAAALNKRLKELEPRVNARPLAVYDVMRMGAAGNGVTDDTRIIDGILRQLVSDGGGHLHFPAGTYKYTGSALTIPSNVTVSGAGMGASTLDFPTNGAAANRRLFCDTGTHDVLIRDLTITSSTATSRTGVYGLIHVDGCTNVHVARVELTNSPGVGVMFMRGTTASSVSRCWVHDNWADGIHYQRGTTNCDIVGNTLSGNGDDDIALQSHGYSEVANGGPWGFVSDIRVLGNTCGNQDPVIGLGTGIYLGGAVGCVVADNVVRNCQAGGIVNASLNGGGSEGHAMTGQNLIRGNTIQNAGLAGGGLREAIKIANARSVRVEGNLIDTTDSNGITLAGALIDVAVVGNSITNCPSRGILVEPTEVSAAEYLELWTNARWSTGESLAYVFAHRVEVSGNAIDGTGIEGIFCTGSVTRQIAGLTLRGNRVSNYNIDNNPGNDRGISVEYVDDCADDDDNHVLQPFAGSTGDPYFFSNTARTIARQQLGADGTVIETTAAEVPSTAVLLGAGKRYVVRGQVLYTVGSGTALCAIRPTYTGTLGSASAGVSQFTIRGTSGNPTVWAASPRIQNVDVNATMPTTTGGMGAMPSGEKASIDFTGTVYTSTAGTLAIEAISSELLGFVPKAGTWIEVVEVKA